MLYTSKREFDELVDSSQEIIHHSKYRTTIVSIMKNPEDYLIPLNNHHDLDEPIYLLIRKANNGQDELRELLDVLLTLNKKDILYGLILIDMRTDYHARSLGMLFIENTRYNLNVRELHWYNPNEYITYYGATYRFAKSIFSNRYLKVLGLYGHARRLLETTNLIDIPFETFIMDQLDAYYTSWSGRSPYALTNATIVDSKIEFGTNRLIPDPRINVKVKYMSDVSQLFDTSEIESLSITNPTSTLFEDDIIDRYSTLQDLDLKHIRHDTLQLPHLPELTTLRITKRSTRSIEQLTNFPTYHEQFPNLRIYHVYDMNIESYENTFDQLENVTEVKIDINSEIPSSIYDMPSLRLLILFRPTLEVLKNIDHERIGDRFEISIDEVPSYDNDTIMKFIGEYDHKLSDRIIYELMLLIS